MKKNYQTNLILVLLLSLLTLYLLNSSLVIKSILDYTSLYITKLFPTTFIIYTLTSLLLNYQIINKLSKLTKHPASLYIIFFSLLSGFPTGPKYISELYQNKYITKDTSNKLLRYVHFPNPLFILGPVSVLLNSKSLAIKILISLILSNLIIKTFSKTNSKEQVLVSNNTLPFSDILNKAIISSFKLQILIYGTNLFFYLISVIITTYIKLTPVNYVLTIGLFDLIKGIFTTSILSSLYLKAMFIVFFLSLGSISIHIQIKSILTDASLNYKHFFQGRLISTILALVIFTLLYIF